MIGNVRLGVDGTGRTLAYNLPRSARPGDVVELPPLPWMDGAAVGVVQPGDVVEFDGDVRAAKRVLTEIEVAELRERRSQRLAFDAAARLAMRCTATTKAGRSR